MSDMGKRKAAPAPVDPAIVDAEAAKITGADLSMLRERLGDIAAHVTSAVAAAPLGEVPFPHALIAPILPEWLYEMLRRAWPSRAFFGEPAPSRRILDLGTGHGSFDQLPAPLAEFWMTLQREVLQAILGRAMVDRYAPYFDGKFARLLPEYAAGGWRHPGLEYERAGLMIHSPGFALRPHVDSARYAVVYLLYCPPDDTHAEEGTDLFAMPEGAAPSAPSLRTFYPEVDAALRPAVSLPYRRNALATFLVAERSLHGVTIKQLDDRRVINCAVKLPDAVVERLTPAS